MTATTTILTTKPPSPVDNNPPTRVRSFSTRAPWLNPPSK
jgi:hypothetical protein